MKRTSLARYSMITVGLFAALTLNSGCRLSNWLANGNYSIIIPLFGGQGGFLTPFFPTAGGFLPLLFGNSGGGGGGGS